MAWSSLAMQPWVCLTVKPGQRGITSDEVAAQLGNASAPQLEASTGVLSALDGRESRRVHATPGGDMGEFVLALSVLDDITGGTFLSSAERVLSALEAVVAAKGALYMCTDAAAVSRLEAALDNRGFQLAEAEARPPRIDAELLDALVLPDHVGCRHLRCVLQHPGAYGVRRVLAAWAVQAFYRLLWSPAHSARMRLVVHQGTSAERAVVLVQTEHLVAPRFGAQLLVLHPAAVQAERKRLALWLAHHAADGGQQQPGRGAPRHMPEVQPAALLAGINARGAAQLQLTLDALAGGLPIVSARTDGPMVTLLAAPTSGPCLGPLMLAVECHALRDLTAVDLSVGEHRSAAFARANPYAKVPALRTSAGVCLGESAAILRFLANSFGPAQLYPARTDPAACARIDFAIDAFANEGCLRGHNAVVYPLLGFAAPPDDQPTANEQCAAALERWCAAFLEGRRFVGGAHPTIADYRVAPFFYACAHPAVAAGAGFRCPERVKRFVADFAAWVPSASLLGAHPSGRSIGEALSAVDMRPRAAPPAPLPPSAPSAGLLLGSIAPDFSAESTHGRLRFHEHIEGSWSLLLSHPDDFTPVCTTELGSVRRTAPRAPPPDPPAPITAPRRAPHPPLLRPQAAQLLPQFAQRGVKVLALSCNDTRSHRLWAVDVLALARLPAEGGFPFPIVADPSRAIAARFGMLDGTNPQPGIPLTCRAAFVFGPDKKLRLSLLYPASSGARGRSRGCHRGCASARRSSA